MIDEDTSWVQRAACRGMDTEMFYESAGNVCREARLVCDSCSVKNECLEDALTVSLRDDFGYRGGTSVKQRKQIRRQRVLDGTWRPVELRFDDVLERFYRV